MPENASLAERCHRIKFAFLEREATPRLLMVLNSRLYLAKIYIFNIVLEFEIFDI